jgi:hypothetical protein
MADPPAKFDPFKPAQPRIPGVSDAPAAVAPEPAPDQPALRAPRGKLPTQWIAAGAAGAVVLGMLLAWIFLRPAARNATASQASPAAASPVETTAAAASSSATVASEVPPIYPDEVATTEEMGKPWAWKRFNFMKAIAQGPVPAMVVRLPGGSSKNEASYWAFSLRSRYGKCDMEIVTDLERLRTEFGYGAQHPMIVEPCTSTVFDPLRRATVSGAWVRGEIVQGAALRPPLMMDVQLKGNRILVVQME